MNIQKNNLKKNKYVPNCVYKESVNMQLHVNFNTGIQNVHVICDVIIYIFTRCSIPTWDSAHSTQFA